MSKALLVLIRKASDGTYPTGPILIEGRNCLSDARNLARVVGRNIEIHLMPLLSDVGGVADVWVGRDGVR